MEMVTQTDMPDENQNKATGLDEHQDTASTGGKAVYYEIDDTPAPHMCFIFGLQQAIMCISGVLSIPYIITELICIPDRDDVRAELLSISLVMCGTATILQDILGVRLPIVQGGSHSFIAALVAVMSLEKWKCPAEDAPVDPNQDADHEWQIRMCEIQGGLILASLTQVILGYTGLIGFIMNFIGPLTISPTISLIGLSLTPVAWSFNEKHWGIAAMSAVLLILCTVYLHKLNLPFPVYSKEKGCHVIWYPLLQLIPVLLAIGITWLFCYILTIEDVFPADPITVGYHARTDIRLHTVDRAPWLYFPYPFMFGKPTFSSAGYIAFLAATVASVIESIGDYFACAKISGAPPPPSHAINRGIGMEGFSSIISGMLGAGHGTTSYSQNVGAIGMTKVASRAVFVMAGVILVLSGIIGKFGAVLTLIPEPVVGGTLTVLLGMVSAVGVSALQHVDLQKSRNLTILGTALICGLMLPQWITKNPKAVDTGSDSANQIINVILGTPMFVGGFIGFILDNTAPGTLEERGVAHWRKTLSGGKQSSKKAQQIYDFPYVMKYIRKVKCFTYIPVCPTFINPSSCLDKNHKTYNTEEQTDEKKYENSEPHLTLYVSNTDNSMSETAK